LSTDDLGIVGSPEARSENPNTAESEDEQFGLAPLLQQMSLAELREIARQRGWHVKGTSKADYVSVMAALLCDPTETARAVTEMPEHLREALRAAFVADDGSGITATTMAQTLTALRTASRRCSEWALARTQNRAAEPGSQSQPANQAGSPPVGHEQTHASRRDGRRDYAMAGLALAEDSGSKRQPVSTVKPVEAAALLVDLARWGLVLPWRDSLCDQGRHVLPWHVQRLLPPLSGWCPLAEQAPAGPTQARDARRFVNSLHGVWKTIADEHPALASGRPLASAGQVLRTEPVARTHNGGLLTEGQAERRLQSLTQGWPYDPHELLGWAGNRRRAEMATQVLSVPMPTFLIEQSALPTLARMGQVDGSSPAAGRGEELEFVCRVLCELGLVSIQNGHLQAQHEQMARFLRRSVGEQHRAAAQAYLSLLDWSELHVLLRRNPQLQLWRRPYFAMPYDQFRSWLIRLRHLLLRFLACAGEEGWCRLDDVEAALHELWPRFQATLQSDRESWLLQAWGLAWHPPARESDTAEAPAPEDMESEPQSPSAPNLEHSREPPTAWQLSAKRAPASWEASQGALLHAILEGPLYWLGFAELSYRDGQLSAFRLHGLANWIWDRPAAWFDSERESAEEVLKIDETAGTVSVRPGSVAPEALTFLGHLARLEQAEPERFVYHLHPQAALSAFESGTSLSDLFAEWKRVMPRPIPSALQETLSQWWARYGQVRLYDGFGLLELRDEVTLQELEASTSLSQHIVARLSPRIVLVRDEAVDSLLHELVAKGYAPKDVD
jgi:hypothetical protein